MRHLRCCIRSEALSELQQIGQVDSSESLWQALLHPFSPVRCVWKWCNHPAYRSSPGSKNPRLLCRKQKNKMTQGNSPFRILKKWYLLFQRKVQNICLFVCLFQVALLLWPLCAFFFKYVHLEDCVLAFYFLPPSDGPFPGWPDRAPACRNHQLGTSGFMDWSVVKANWTSVWGWWRHIIEMILDNIQNDVLPQGWLEGFCFCVFFSAEPL